MSKDGLKIYCDGGARGNPGPAAAAFVVVDNGKAVYKGSRYLGVTTNNVAEYKAVLMALSWLINNSQKVGSDRVYFFLDSQLVTRQLTGDYKIKSRNLKPLLVKIKKLEGKGNFNAIYKSVPRTKNRLADFLVNKVLDQKAN